MADQDLYHQQIMDLARAETGAGALDDADASATINNPLCGDRVRIDLKLSGQAVSEIAHRVRGCALCRAAAVVIGTHAPGESPARLREVADLTAAMLKTGAAPAAGAWAEIAAFQPVAARKSRHDCVLLPFQALVAALDEAAAES